MAVINKLVLSGKDQKALSAVLRGMKELEGTEDQLKANIVPVQFVYGGLGGQPNVDLMSDSWKV